jgi:hypothetical protein
LPSELAVLSAGNEDDVPLRGNTPALRLRELKAGFLFLPRVI